ncbi:MAG: hypothetical protein IH614_16325 [Desulfuromonadales bacterium]|nr:hypothetical protein [Desulfuromonadales bacterium]
MRRSTIILTIAVLTAAVSAMAAVPAPPVNQYLGIADSTFNQIGEEQCRFCHNQNPPLAAVDPTYLPQRHHNLMQQPIVSPTDVPYPDANRDGVADTRYDCLNCHVMNFNAAIAEWEVVGNFRDCGICHQQTANAPTVHHRVAEAQSGDCFYCHGSFVDRGLLDDDQDGIQNAVDPQGGWIPTYQASGVTPWPSDKPAGDPATTNIWGAEAGNCTFCHSNATGLNSESTIDNTGPFAPVAVRTNEITHHVAGFGPPVVGGTNPNNKCFWCHDFRLRQIDSTDIRTATPVRTCGNCHGIPSLHNIQYAAGQSAGSPSSGTVRPGAEPAGFGHIGSQQDCWGCHGFELSTTASAPKSGAVIPSLYYLSASGVRAGNTITLTGTGFINDILDAAGSTMVTLDSQVALTDAAGFETIVAPIEVTGDSIKVQIPSGVPAGNYRIAAKKALKYSNPLNLTITPAVTVYSALCSQGVVDISGTGFSSYLNAVNSGTSVEAAAATELVRAQILAWDEDQIKAKFSACPDSVIVSSVFGRATAEVANTDPTDPTDPPKPGKGKSEKPENPNKPNKVSGKGNTK